MHASTWRLLLACLATVIFAGCAGDGGERGLANPASVHCEDHGGTLSIVEDADGSQTGICEFPDGSSCEEWAFYRGECGPGG